MLITKRSSEFWRWHQGTSKEKQILSPWPVRRSPSWVDYVNEPQSESELNAIRKNVKRGCPLGDEKWSSNIVARLSLKSILRPPWKAQQTQKRFLTPLFYTWKAQQTQKRTLTPLFYTKNGS